MIHGAAKHVIIIKNPDKHLFEQVIFVLKRDLFEKNGKSEDEILAEAKRAAEGYVQKAFPKRAQCYIIRENIDR